MSVIKGDIFTVFITIILEIGSFCRNKATIYAVLNTDLLTRYEIALIVYYLNVDIPTIESFDRFYHNLLTIKELESRI